MPVSAVRVGDGAAVELDEAAFGARWNEALVHECVRAELNARRQGTAATKTRGEVRGGGAKPWRQKGTGRARHGSSRSPIWTGGGTVFGPSPRHYTVKVNRKARRAALRSALSLHAGRGTLAVFDAAAFDAPATRRAAELVSSWERPRGRALVVLHADEGHAGRSFRNIASLSVLSAEEVGVADLVGARAVLLSERALAELTTRAAREGQV